MQASEGELDHPIAFSSRKLSKAKKNYSTIECKGLAMVYALQNFRNYLLGRHFNMYTDYSTLNYLVNKPMLGGGGDMQMPIVIPRKKKLGNYETRNVECSAVPSIVH